MTPEEEINRHLKKAAQEEHEAAELMRERAEELEKQAKETESGKAGGEKSAGSGWNLF